MSSHRQTMNSHFFTFVFFLKRSSHPCLYSILIGYGALQYKEMKACTYLCCVYEMPKQQMQCMKGSNQICLTIEKAFISQLLHSNGYFKTKMRSIVGVHRYFKNKVHHHICLPFTTIDLAMGRQVPTIEARIVSKTYIAKTLNYLCDRLM